LEIGGRSAGNRRGAVWEGLSLTREGLSPSPVRVWGLVPRESFEIYVNADANFSLSKWFYQHDI